MQGWTHNKKSNPEKKTSTKAILLLWREITWTLQTWTIIICKTIYEQTEQVPYMKTEDFIYLLAFLLFHNALKKKKNIQSVGSPISTLLCMRQFFVGVCQN